MDLEPYPEYDRPVDEPAEPVVAAIRLRPVVWPVFVTFLIMLVVGVVVQVVLVVGWLIWKMIEGANPAQFLNDLMNDVTSVEGFVILASGSQVTVGAAAIVGAWFFREPMTSSLGMTRPALALWEYPIVILGGMGPGSVGAALALALGELIPPDDSLDKVCDNLNWVNVAPFILFISFVPGIFEELFFRGYMQRRLLQAWSPGAAILVSSLLFGIMHLYPHQAVFAFVIGLWLGVIAWRTGSFWPGVLCHACWNGCAVGLTVALKWLNMEDDPPLLLGGIGGALVLVCFLLSLWILFRQPPPSTPPLQVAELDYREPTDSEPPA